MHARRLLRGLSITAACWVLGWVGAAAAQEAAYGSAAAGIAEKIAAAFPKVSGQVIGLEKERILLDLGAKDSVIPGLELQVYREGQEFKHPYTGQSSETGSRRRPRAHPGGAAELLRRRSSSRPRGPWSSRATRSA
jgi:hypothetical protein